MPRDGPTIRRHLDNRLAQLPDARMFAKPPTGWIRAIRQALGMSATDLAARMGLSKARVLAIEKSEAVGVLNLDTLHRAAEALDCTLVYALIPRKPLDQTVRERALEVAAEHLSAVDHTMRLEDQGVGGQAAQRQLHEVAGDIVRRSPRSLWKRRATR
jgi:predicted DNA-binding mobile mystery protein A